MRNKDILRAVQQYIKSNQKTGFILTIYNDGNWRVDLEIHAYKVVRYIIFKKEVMLGIVYYDSVFVSGMAKKAINKISSVHRMLMSNNIVDKWGKLVIYD